MSVQMHHTRNGQVVLGMAESGEVVDFGTS